MFLSYFDRYRDFSQDPLIGFFLEILNKHINITVTYDILPYDFVKPMISVCVIFQDRQLWS